MDRVAVVIQARSTSTRLPNKGMMPLQGMPVVSHVVQACRAAKVGPVIVAVPEGDTIGDYIRHTGEALVYEGSEQNVLERFYGAALSSCCDHVVRVTGDCPLMWPDLVRWVVTDHLEEGNDFTTLIREPHRIIDGLDVEVISLPLLRFLLDYTDYPESREHVTWHIYRHWNEMAESWRLKSINYPLPMGDKFSLDTKEDYDRIKAHLAATN